MSGHSLTHSSSFSTDESHSRVQRTALLLSRGAFIGAAICIVLMLAVAYRLWALATAQEPSGVPFGTMFALGEAATAPFGGTGTPATKETGYLDFPSIVALDVYLVATFFLTIFGYLCSLILPRKIIEPAPVAKVKQPPKPHVVPAIRATMRGTGHGIAFVAGGAVALVTKPDWAGYATMIWLAITGAIIWTALQVRRGAVAYWTGLQRDWVELKAFSKARWAETAPRLRQLGGALRTDGSYDIAAAKVGAQRGREWTKLRTGEAWAFTKASSAATSQRVGQLAGALRTDFAHDVADARVALGRTRVWTTQEYAATKVRLARSARRSRVHLRRGWRRSRAATQAGVAGLRSGMSSVLSQDSRCYWCALSSASRSIVTLPSAFLYGRRREDEIVLPEGLEESLQPAEHKHVSRREFLRRVSPLR